MTSLAIDLRVMQADRTMSRNILSNRASVSQEGGYVGQQSFKLKSLDTINIPNLFNNSAFILHSKLPVRVTGAISGNPNPTVFENQNVMVMTTGISSLTIENLNDVDTDVTIIRFAESAMVPVDPIVRTKIFFLPFSNISALPATVQDLSNLVVQNMALGYMINDQATPPGTGIAVQNKFRICNADGTPNSNGQYIMILDNNVIEQNFTGDLYFWVEETL